MLFYHFTSRFHIQGCLKEGINKGSIPISIEKKLTLSGYQWLTINSDFDQSWCRYSTLPYDRTDFRMTLKFPKKIIKTNVIKWDEHALNFVSEEMMNTLNEFGDSHNWYLFKGFIKPKYIKSVAAKDKKIESIIKIALIMHDLGFFRINKLFNS